MQVSGFGPESKAWKALVLPGYTTPAYVRYISQKYKSYEEDGGGIEKMRSYVMVEVRFDPWYNVLPVTVTYP